MGLATADLIADYKHSLFDAVEAFCASDDGDFLRHLRTAARDIAGSKRPRTRLGTLTLAAGVFMYASPPDLLFPKISRWGVDAQLPMWNAPSTPLPIIRRVATGVGWQLELSPAPTYEQINAFGSEYPYYYLATYQIPDVGESDITGYELSLLLLRAQVEAMRELSVRDSKRLIRLRGGLGLSTVSKNLTPSALYDALLSEYREAA